MRPKLRNLVPDIYKDVTYVLDEDSYHSADYQDIIRKRFIKMWEKFMDGYKVTFMGGSLGRTADYSQQDSFTEQNYRMFFGLTLQVIIRPWEKFMMGFKFTEVRLGSMRIRLMLTLKKLGAMRFDRDLRAITTYLSSQTAFGDAREKFTRLQQMSTLLNLDPVRILVPDYGRNVTYLRRRRTRRSFIMVQVFHGSCRHKRRVR